MGSRFGPCLTIILLVAIFFGLLHSVQRCSRSASMVQTASGHVLLFSIVQLALVEWLGQDGQFDEDILSGAASLSWLGELFKLVFCAIVVGVVYVRHRDGTAAPNWH